MVNPGSEKKSIFYYVKFQTYAKNKITVIKLPTIPVSPIKPT